MKKSMKNRRKIIEKSGKSHEKSKKTPRKIYEKVQEKSMKNT